MTFMFCIEQSNGLTQASYLCNLLDTALLDGHARPGWCDAFRDENRRWRSAKRVTVIAYYEVISNVEVLVGEKALSSACNI